MDCHRIQDLRSSIAVKMKKENLKHAFQLTRTYPGIVPVLGGLVTREPNYQSLTYWQAITDWEEEL